MWRTLGLYCAARTARLNGVARLREQSPPGVRRRRSGDVPSVLSGPSRKCEPRCAVGRARCGHARARREAVPFRSGQPTTSAPARGVHRRLIVGRPDSAGGRDQLPPAQDTAPLARRRRPARRARCG
jgi:hypothetical protein